MGGERGPVLSSSDIKKKRKCQSEVDGQGTQKVVVLTRRYRERSFCSAWASKAAPACRPLPGMSRLMTSAAMSMLSSKLQGQPQERRSYGSIKKKRIRTAIGLGRVERHKLVQLVPVVQVES